LVLALTFQESKQSFHRPSRHHILRARNAKQGESPAQQHGRRTLRWLMQMALDSRIVGSKYGTVHGAAIEQELSVQDVQYSKG
jgi:hypothetical protein